MHREVNLTKRVNTPGGPRYSPVVMSANGRVKPDAVLIDGKEERHPEGAYYIEWRDAGKRIRLSVGKDAADANAMRLRKETELNNGDASVPQINGNSRSLAASVAAYLEEIRLSKKPKTHSAYSTALEYFAESCHKVNVGDIDRRDLLKFAAFLRDEKEQGPRSVSNKFEHVMTFLKAQGVHGLVGKNDRPRYTEEEPEIYEQAELDSLFGACDSAENVWFEFFLKTGMREQEVMHTYWSDVNLAKSTVRVTHKPDRGWTPKAYKERTIPIHSTLAESLTALKQKAPADCSLVFPTAGCNPKLDFLDCLKRTAKRAGLNPAEFWLHKFRATFATRALRAGNDLRTVQSWLGHSDIESTMRYLRADDSPAVRDRVAAMF